MNKTFIETKEYKRFAEFCDACIKYKYIGICYGAPGVGKTLSSRYYCNWDNIEKQIAYRRADDIGKDATDEILSANKVFYTSPAEKMTRISSDIHTLATRIDMVKTMHLVFKYNQKEIYASHSYEGIDLIIDPEIEEMPICCDPKEIERCVINLIGNAVKFTESGGEIKVLIKEYENNVSISIADTGLGISNDDQEFIFKRFEQGKSSNSTQVSSSGIGLTLVKYIVELHGGQVTLESEINKGSTFTIILPIS